MAGFDAPISGGFRAPRDNRPIVSISHGANGSCDPVVTIDWPSTSETLFSLTGYDSRSNATNTIDAKGNTAVTVFDGASRAIETIEHLRVDGQGDNGPLPGKTFTPSGGSCVVTQSEYDANSRVTKLIDDRGGTTSYSFDTLDREIEMEFHDGAKRLYVYNAASDLTEYTDENGSVFDHSYDTLGRRVATAITRASGVVGTTALSATFDGLSRPLLMRDTDGSADADVNHVHDALGRIVEYSQTYDGETHHVTHTAFTSAVPTQVTYPDGREVNSSYLCSCQLERPHVAVISVGDPVGGADGRQPYNSAGRIADLGRSRRAGRALGHPAELRVTRAA